MPAAKLAGPADHLLKVAATHPEYRGGEVLDEKRVRLDLNVEMPLAAKADGISSTGVQITESVIFHIPSSYPWQSPRVTLRDDFPRGFPHMLPGSKESPPRPCLVEGDPDEFFLQYGLFEYGIYHLIEQLAQWLRKAAIDHLNDPDHGWEPMMRRGMSDMMVFDAQAAIKEVTRNGGYAAWRANYLRRGEIEAEVNNGAEAYVTSDAVKAPLASTDRTLFNSKRRDAVGFGNTVIGIVWPDKFPGGAVPVCDQYIPEDVVTLADLRERAKMFGCERGLDLFLKNLQRCWAGYSLEAPIPVGVVLCAQRPFPLVGSESDIELLPYVFEIRPFEARNELIMHGDEAKIGPAIHYQSLTPRLLQTMSDLPDRPAVALLGCGSVGSKLAMHAARGGQNIVAVSDSGWLRPHNLARHALGGRHTTSEKAPALAQELAELKQTPLIFKGDIAAALRDKDQRVKILPPKADVAINATASLSVREALTESTKSGDRTRNVEVALFGRGRLGYLLLGAKSHNPNHCDLIAELYATLTNPDAVKLLADPELGLAQVQIGQGCSSLTMAIDDAQISMMTAGLSKEIGRWTDEGSEDGSFVIGISDTDSPATQWHRQTVEPFEVVPIKGSYGWQLRISRRVVDKIRHEALSFADVETGGLMIGLSSERLKTVTVVDIIDAPADSTRSASEFVLGKEGLQASIEKRHVESGQTLFDVGTWHSHLVEQGPSPTDWNTAAVLKAGRAPPSVLLIVTPTKFHALIGKEDLGV
jgi:Prokaryotic E2 family A